MTIKPGDRLPDARLYEYVAEPRDGCSVGPAAFQVADESRGKRVLIFAVPGAFTPTCSNQHLPGYVREADALRARGVDEIWCVAVNDVFVMDAWGREHAATGKVRMMADGSAELTRKLGLETDLSARGLGVRSQRYAMLVEDGVVRSIAIEAPGRFEVSDAGSMLAQLS